MAAVTLACRQCQESYAEPAPRYCGRCGAELHAGMHAEFGDGHDPLVGRVVGGRYRMIERIGAGGMGVVYKVEHLAMGKIAALKMLHPLLSTDREVVKRFRTEARAVSLLTHPNSVQVFDFGEADGSLYMVMELVRGDELSKILDREHVLPWKRTASLLYQICEALGEAHEAGIVHRDLKPENIVVRRARDGREHVKVLDFGLAKLRERDEPANITGGGMLIGTPYYMAPEQIRGEGADARTDIYALGAVAYRALTGVLPFEGTSPVAVFTAHLQGVLVPPSRRRPDLRFEPPVEELVVRCLARDPAARFPSVDHLRRAIEQAQDPARTPVSVAAVDGPREESGVFSSLPLPRLSRGDFDRFERSMRRRRWVGLASVLAVLGGAGAVGAWLLRDQMGRPVEEEVEPNDTPKQANPIALGKGVRGHIGKRLSLENSDHDVFSFQVPALAPGADVVDRRPGAVLRFALTPIPNMDLHLAVFDGRGTKLTETDAGGAGAGEAIPNLRLEPGEHYVAVREVWISGRLPTENVTDWYTLTATARPLSADEESEPDDMPQEALPLALGRPITGYLGRADDVDFFYPRGAANGSAALDGKVSGIPGVDVVLVVLPPGAAVAEKVWRTPGARVFDAGGPGAGETFMHVPWPPGGAAPLIVVARKDPPVDKDGRRPPLAGIDVSYELLVEATGRR